MSFVSFIFCMLVRVRAVGGGRLSSALTAVIATRDPRPFLVPLFVHTQ
jgi:hypothetical protein